MPQTCEPRRKGLPHSCHLALSSIVSLVSEEHNKACAVSIISGCFYKPCVDRPKKATVPF